MRLADGSVIAADVVVVGVGVVPGTDWLEGSGLTLDNGVVCDETCLAAPGVVAAGDVARLPNALFDGELMRLEHWTNATEQGVHAARRLLAGDDGAIAFAPVPFVWSDQYDRKIQTVGMVSGDADLHVAHGSYDGAAVRRAVRPRRPARRRARVQPRPPGHAVPQADSIARAGTSLELATHSELAGIPPSAAGPERPGGCRRELDHGALHCSSSR